MREGRRGLKPRLGMSEGTPRGLRRGVFYFRGRALEGESARCAWVGAIEWIDGHAADRLLQIVELHGLDEMFGESGLAGEFDVLVCPVAADGDPAGGAMPDAG